MWRSGKAVLFLLISAAYCAVTLPEGASFSFAAAECLLCSLVAVALWSSCVAVERYRIPDLPAVGRWIYVGIVLVFSCIQLSLAIAAAALSGCADACLAALPLKSFCLLSLHSALCLGSILYARCRLELEEPLPAAGIPAGKAVNKPAPEQINSISVRTAGGIRIISIEEVVFLKAEGDYVSIVTGSGSFLKEQTMKYFAEVLPPERFIRVHRSYIIHSRYLQSIERYGDYQTVLMTGGERIRISASGGKLLKERLGL